MMRLTSGIVAVAYALTLMVFTALRPALPIDETRYLDVAWEMHVRGDFLHLTRNFATYTHKPPLLFWVINLIWAVFGVGDYAARLAGPIFAVAAVFVTGRLARRFWPDAPGVGLGATLAMVGFSVFSLYGGALMFDAMLAVAVLCGVGVLWRIGQGHDDWRSWAAFGLALAFGIYAKGPVIFVHLAPILLTMRFWAHAAPSMRNVLRGMALALGVTIILLALWLVPALLQASESVQKELLWDQTVSRVSGGMAHDRSWLFLVMLLPVFLFPWGWSLAFWRRMPRTLRQDPAARLSAIWAISALVLFSLISSKQVHYLIPELPAMALLLARVSGDAPLGRLRLACLPLVALALVAFGAAAGWISLGHAAEILSSLVLVAAGVAFLGLAVAFWRAKSLAAQAGAGLAVVAVVQGAVLFSGVLAAYDGTAIAARLAQAEPGGLAIAGMTYNAEFNFAARLTTPIATPGSASDLRLWAVAHPDGLVFGPQDRIPVTTPPEWSAVYNGYTLGFWPASDVAANVQE
jgi:4-amino-4-deoxy-L-arabinose transferase-like glycosyltransferase